MRLSVNDYEGRSATQQIPPLNARVRAVRARDGTAPAAGSVLRGRPVAAGECSETSLSVTVASIAC